MRLLLVTNSPTPYRLPLFQEIHDQCREAGIEFEVAFGAMDYGRRQWVSDPSAYDFPYTVLSSRRISLDPDREHTLFLYDGLWRTIRRVRPDVVIVPGFSFATVKAAAFSLVGGPPYLIWTGSIPVPGRNDSRLRSIQRRLLARRAAGALAYGSLASAYLSGLGMRPEDVHIAINTVETEFFRSATSEERARLSADASPAHLTYVGYLSPRKNVGRLIDLIEILARERSDFILDIVGDGSERERLEGRSRALGLDDLVVFHGYRPQSELPRYLARSRCVLLQTDYDIWGLVAVEAMAAGVPVISSVRAGVSHDLIRQAETGYVADFADPRSALPHLRWMLDHPAEAAEMGRRASRLVSEEATLELSAAAFVAAARSVVSE